MKSPSIKTYLRRQKRNLKYRVWNPTKYLIELGQIHLGKGSGSSRTAESLVRVALVSDLDAPSSEQQFYPFSTYRASLRSKLNLVSTHLRLNEALRAPSWLLPHFDMIFLKLSYRTDPADALAIVQTLERAAKGRKLIYFDGDDDICIQWPEILPHVDAYVKKHAFRDRTRYLQKYAGKSNLHDYVHRKFNYVFTTRDYGNPWEKQLMISESGPVPAAYLDKILLGVDLAGDDVIWNLYHKVKAAKEIVPKEFDIIFRGAVTKGTIVYHLRGGIEPVLREMEGLFRVIIPTERVPRDEYYREMMRSRICISPFGYGEICWRDYEAVLCRSLLIKPNMDHLETYPDIFKPHETYVPVEWDFSDLREKCEYYLKNDTERERIVETAYRVLDEFYKTEAFVSATATLVKKVREQPLQG